jgi:hypothetical protein
VRSTRANEFQASPLIGPLAVEKGARIWWGQQRTKLNKISFVFCSVVGCICDKPVWRRSRSGSRRNLPPWTKLLYRRRCPTETYRKQPMLSAVSHQNAHGAVRFCSRFGLAWETRPRPLLADHSVASSDTCVDLPRAPCRSQTNSRASPVRVVSVQRSCELLPLVFVSLTSGTQRGAQSKPGKPGQRITSVYPSCRRRFASVRGASLATDRSCSTENTRLRCLRTRLGGYLIPGREFRCYLWLPGRRARRLRPNQFGNWHTVPRKAQEHGRQMLCPNPAGHELDDNELSIL